MPPENELFKTAVDQARVKRWMKNNVDAYVDRRTDEVNSTGLAEAAADEFDKKGLGGWLDDPNHWVWDLAAQIADAHERKKTAAVAVVERFVRAGAIGDRAFAPLVVTAGASFKRDRMSVLFVQGRKPVPFNRDTIDEINRTTIPVFLDVAVDGKTQEDINLRVVGYESSAPLTAPQEKLGWKREVKVDIEYPIDQGGSSKTSARTALAELARLGKQLGFKVEPVQPGYKPQTRTN